MLERKTYCEHCKSGVEDGEENTPVETLMRDTNGSAYLFGSDIGLLISLNNG